MEKERDSVCCPFFQPPAWALSFLMCLVSAFSPAQQFICISFANIYCSQREHACKVQPANVFYIRENWTWPIKGNKRSFLWLSLLGLPSFTSPFIHVRRVNVSESLFSPLANGVRVIRGTSRATIGHDSANTFCFNIFTFYGLFR